ncbi:MAG: hypothetical protein P8M30_10585 [Planctomycetaceae bacterium]|jgi:hypothetical protein|nr:hypothetical protein [bacterium]MDB4679458.1 hypothetical protein [Planctomycetaceae bacterium]MDB4787016.1 hypothetical protein [Planctomycetaceae bacterium]MDC0273814.1 hypothetical protein [Planctomycetaceae bacterium]MDG2389752.1 hypothetical protein [Planctomycetaceae bacterium]
MATVEETKSWPDLAIGLYDRLNERNAEIVYDFEDLEVNIPSAAKDSATHAPWKINGKMKITTRNGVSG